ncbi:DNA recombination protein RmuC [Tianweitania sp. BSSL-BM11]|uniref:DNA recombination protein RmuC homolog n=1 Tax=Tianweitania aestuarii TaxID=2814886 RepID=A0ABS5RQM5_9HYPH|nr:DNA recombination protein RmuC [Tianweitania aestuarii]MBS9719346.1 DNA recombination protein RmuC [Tianweitania aestuarii]
MNRVPDLSTPLFRLGASTVSLGMALVVGAILVGVLVFLFVLALRRATGGQAALQAEALERARQNEQRMAALLQAQSEMQGRMGALAEVFSSRQAELNRSIGERLDGMTNRLGHSLTEQTRATHENLARLQERLVAIDTAQNNIQSLAGQVVQLQAILSNKQTRGAFGQSRMEAIVADGLPQGGYEFQATLSNGNRPDCLIRMPNNTPSLVIDAKFPLEAWNAIRAAEDDTAKRMATQAFRRDIEIHVRAIADKYLIPQETQDTAFMFVPSESIFAEIHEHFEAIVQKAHRARVVIVSPSLLMLSIQVVQAILKDARMREQAHLIQREVVRLMEDVGRLDDRVRKLQGHFGQTTKDIDDILVSTKKLTSRGAKIEALELGSETVGEDAPAPPRQGRTIHEPKSGPEPRAGSDVRSAQLHLRVVDED